MLALCLSLGLLKASQFLFDLELFVLGGLGLLSLFNERPHAFIGEFQELSDAFGCLQLGKLVQSRLCHVPNWPQVALALFFDNDLFKDSLDRLFTALRVFVVKDINNLLLALERRVARADQLRSMPQDSVRVALAYLVNFLRLLDR